VTDKKNNPSPKQKALPRTTVRPIKSESTAASTTTAVARVKILPIDKAAIALSKIKKRKTQ
jgi:hypothetical protein